MAIHLKRTLIIFATLMVIMQTTRGQNKPPPAETEEEDDNSSSEETQEESNETTHKRRRRTPDSAAEGTEVSTTQTKAGLPAIPGLPDPETILKIAEVLTTVGQQVLPILVSALG